MVNIRSVFTGRWSSTHHDFQIAFNGRVWIVLSEYEDAAEMMVSLVDRTDGSTVMVNLEQLEGGGLETEQVERFLFADLFNKDNRIKVIARGIHPLLGKEFNFVQYAFHNRKRGKQRLVDLFRYSNDKVLLLRCGAPIGLPPEEGTIVPGKLHVLLSSMRGELGI